MDNAFQHHGDTVIFNGRRMTLEEFEKFKAEAEVTGESVEDVVEEHDSERDEDHDNDHEEEEEEEHDGE